MDDFELDSIEFDFDFDITGFDFSEEIEPTKTEIWSTPVIHKPQTISYEYAQQFAESLDLRKDTFAFVSGNFVFGDFMESLVDLGKLTVKRMGIHTLSLNDENIDSIRNIIEWQPVERLDIVLSDYWYSHERKPGGLVQYLFEELDVKDLDLHVAFCGTHAKVWTVETLLGNTLTVHGSANLRSSGNVEHVCISPNRELFDFCDSMLKRMIETYDVVNQDARKKKSVRRGKLWQAVAAKAAAANAGAVAARVAARKPAD